jgi:5'(3')-deoxyribonucleotidase
MVTVFVDMDDVMCDFTGARKSSLLKNPEIIYPQSQLDYFRQLKPIYGAVEGFNYLLNHFDAYIASAPSIYNPLSYTEKALWIKDHFGNRGLERLILIPQKNLLMGDYLIDDRIDSNGQNKFNGTLIQYGSTKWPNWMTIIEYFETLKK